MMRARYALHAETPGVVFIVDQCRGDFATITNAAETVVQECLSTYGQKRIVYRDTEGRWDELLHTGIQFRGFAPFQGEVPPEGGRAYG
jgi:hypothetical protein